MTGRSRISGNEGMSSILMVSPHGYPASSESTSTHGMSSSCLNCTLSLLISVVVTAASICRLSSSSNSVAGSFSQILKVRWGYLSLICVTFQASEPRNKLLNPRQACRLPLPSAPVPQWQHLQTYAKSLCSFQKNSSFICKRHLFFLFRSNRTTPSSSSSCLSCLLKGGCAMWSFWLRTWFSVLGQW